jgi:uncharacterized RDD family membrane protein YckC
MRYTNLEEKYDQTIKAGCWGCAVYVILFFGLGSVMLYFDFPIISVVPLIGVFVLIWLYFFMKARQKDQRDNNKY